MIELLLALAVLLLAAAVALQFDWSKWQGWLNQRQASKLLQPPAGGSTVDTLDRQRTAVPAQDSRNRIEGTRPGHLRVLDASDLLQVTGAHQLLDHLYRHSKLSRQVFERDLLPAIQRYAEFVQLLPASESHHHAHVGGLLAHAMETCYHALVLRGGHLMAHAAGAEAIDAQRDYWTYAVFVGALMHDVGKPLADLRVDMLQAQGAESARWMPLAGSLRECQALEYRVAFAPKAERDYGAHARLSLVLMQRLVPPNALAFLGRCPEVMGELTQYLGGDARGGTIAKIVSEADQRSTSANLSTGTRARFASARSVPLVEQLMTAMGEMLEQGGQLPLNRDGAAGWVYDGSVWFVAKRLADSVREFIQARAGEDAGVPGENKNDRLFDTWMEYGQLVLNPTTKKAIWHVRVHGEDGAGYSHELSVLRFPLGKIWLDPSGLPRPMAGRIEVLEGRKKTSTADPPVAEPKATATAAEEISAPERPPTKSQAADTDTIAAPRIATDAHRRHRKPTVAAPEGDPGEFLPSADTARASSIALQADKVAKAAEAKPSSKGRVEPEVLATARESPPVRQPESEDSHQGAAGLDRVLLPEAKVVPKQVGEKIASAAAMGFMRWLQGGLADGSLKYNESGAPVHFVEAGIALVSPVIFREYALIHGEPEPQDSSKNGPQHVGLRIQREVIRAGWHLPSPQSGGNIWTFQVSRRGGSKTGKLSALILADARRWVVEPPPPNLALWMEPTSPVGPE